jgi:signal transduction histidine kinase
MTVVAPKLWSFSLAFAAVVACFVVSTLYSQRQEHQVTELAQSITNNAMPSIEHLAIARHEVRHIEGLVDTLETAPADEDESVLAAMRAARETVDSEVDAYLRLTPYPGEEMKWERVRRSLGALDNALATLRAYVTEHDDARKQEAVRAVITASDDAADAVYAEIQFNAHEGASISEEIASIHAHSRRIAFALDFISAVLAIFFASLALRMVSAHVRLLRERNELLSRRADELEQFAGRVAHDIRNPLGGIRFALATIKRNAQNEKVLASVARGDRSIERATHLLDGLLGFAQAGARPAHNASCRVADVVDGVLEDQQPAASEAQVALRREVDASLNVACDPAIFAVVLANLVKNAVRYIGDGADRVVTVRAMAVARERVRVEVEDTGVGVPDELRESIFLPFVRGQRVHDDGPARGIGLGLATVRRIAETHGGRAWVEAAPVRGSRFCVELPAASAVSEPSAAVLLSTAS